MQLDQLLADRADLWRGRATPQAAPAGLPTGFAALDAALCGHGWPRAGASEVLTNHQGAGLALLLPLLVALGKGHRWLLWVDPPYLPFAPALAARGLDLRRILIVHAGADAAWAAEQGLRSGTCAAVLAWTGPAARVGDSRACGRTLGHTACWTPTALRRLQLAAADTDTPMLLLRPPAAAGETSPAVLRLEVNARADGLDLTLLKQRGGRPGQRLRLPATPDAAGPDAADSDLAGPTATGPTALGPDTPDRAAGADTLGATDNRRGGPHPGAGLQAVVGGRGGQHLQPMRIESPPSAARQVQTAGGGVLDAPSGRRARRRRSVPRP